MPPSPAAVARLAAGAKGGTAGVKAYDDAQATVNANKTKAIGQLAGDSAGMSGDTNGLAPKLRSMVAGPAATATGILGQYAAADRAATGATTGATSTYMDEANAAVPVIDAEARLNEAQREAMLAASMSRAATKAPKALSDSQLRTELLGYATRQRAAAAQKAVTRDTALLKRNSAAETNAAHQAEVLDNPDAHYDPNADPQAAARADNAKLEADRAAAQQVLDQAHQQALQQIQQQQYGPGITAEAQQAGVGAGLDPNKVAGLLGPNVEADFLRNNEKLGLYTNPQQVQNVASDAISTATQLGYKPKQYRDAAKATYIDWNGDKSLRGAFAKWITTDPLGVKAAADNPNDLKAVQDAFLKAQPQNNNPKNIVQDVIANAHSAILHGIDYGTFVTNWQHDPAAAISPDAVRLGLGMAQQLFAYAQAQARQTALSPTGQPITGG